MVQNRSFDRQTGLKERYGQLFSSEFLCVMVYAFVYLVEFTGAVLVCSALLAIHLVLFFFLTKFLELLCLRIKGTRISCSHVMRRCTVCLICCVFGLIFECSQLWMRFFLHRFGCASVCEKSCLCIHFCIYV